MISAMFRVSALLGLVGMGLGIAMGIRQDFALAPAHAHLNLLGFVALFLSALYYRAVPEAGASSLAKVQGLMAMAGAILFPVGIACVSLGDHQRFMPVVVVGSLIVFIGMALFAFIVIRTSGIPQPPAASNKS
jgi:xanthine/uracil permease